MNIVPESTDNFATPTRSDASAAAPIVQAEGLSKVIDERPILNGLSFEIAPGTLVALLGANGAGKSTLLKIIGTLTPPTDGVLKLFGRETRHDDPGVRSRLGMIAHGAMLYRDLTARENLLFFGRLYDVSAVEARAEELLDMVNLVSRADDAVKTFSRGMTQRLSIARALMHDPDLLLADEPFSGLDAPSRATLEQLLTDIRNQGKSIILANHDVTQSVMLADRVIVLRRGGIALSESCVDVDVDQVFDAVSTP